MKRTLFALLLAVVVAAGLASEALARHRVYHPTLGRFLQRDPVGTHVMPPPARNLSDPRFTRRDPVAQYADGMNLYEYVGGSPASVVDPTGLYGVDVHRSLTAYLAKHAGFNAEGCKFSPEAVGDATQQVDEDERSPDWGRNVEIHFATPAQLMLHQATALKQTEGTYDCNLRDIGTYLHSLQDTYSHQSGETTRSEWETTGPRKRQAWHAKMGHLPDYTWRRPRLANNMAYTAYYALRDLAKKCCECPNKPTPWSHIEPFVDAFIKHKVDEPWSRFKGLDEDDFAEKVAELQDPAPPR